MFTYFLFLLVLFALLFLLWLFRRINPVPPNPGGFGTRVVDPNFQPIPRPPETFVDPPRRNVDIQVQRNAQGVPVDLVVGQADLRLEAGEQAAWNGGQSIDNNGAKVEIRFSPNSTPFGGASFLTARSGVALSGKATRTATTNMPRKYTILATTPDGFLLTKNASVTPAGGPIERGEEKYQPTASPLIQPAPEGGYGERYEDPNFTPIDRPVEVEFPPSKEVRISAVRREGGEIEIAVDLEEISIGPNEQVAWTTGPIEPDTGGKLEIRFAPNVTPFGGSTFITARSGTVFSGLPAGGAGTIEYRVLLTTSDGIFKLREKAARVTIT